MFTKENIQFESEILIVGDESTKDAIKSKLICLVNQMVEQLKLNSLKGIIIKPQVLFDSNMGTAYADKTIKLSFAIASILANGLECGHSPKYMDALATLYHEGYHISDHQQVGRKLGCLSPAASIGYCVWTEFFAVYATQCICEQDHQYTSFEHVFSEHPKDDKMCRYYASHIMGYYLHNGHSPQCDQLINQFLNIKYIEPTKHHLQEMLERYPNISADDLISLKELFDKLLCNEIDLSNAKELSQEDLISWIRNKSHS